MCKLLLGFISFLQLLSPNKSITKLNSTWGVKLSTEIVEIANISQIGRKEESKMR